MPQTVILSVIWKEGIQYDDYEMIDGVREEEHSKRHRGGLMGGMRIDQMQKR